MQHWESTQNGRDSIVGEGRACPPLRDCLFQGELAAAAPVPPEEGDGEPPKMRLKLDSFASIPGTTPPDPTDRAELAEPGYDENCPRGDGWFRRTLLLSRAGGVPYIRLDGEAARAGGACWL